MNPFELEQLAFQVKRSECATGEPLLVPEMTADEVRRNGVLPEVTGPPGSVRLSEPVRVPPAWVPVTALASAVPGPSPSSTMVNAPIQAGGDVEVVRAGRGDVEVDRVVAVEGLGPAREGADVRTDRLGIANPHDVAGVLDHRDRAGALEAHREAVLELVGIVSRVLDGADAVDGLRVRRRGGDYSGRGEQSQERARATSTCSGHPVPPSWSTPCVRSPTRSGRAGYHER